MARILIIDDDEGFRTSLEQMLLAAGHEVTAAADGFEGCRQYRAHPVDLVLMDMVMPHSGLTAIQVLLQQYPTLKVIAMSGAGTHRLGFARGFGARRSLAKPFTFAQLTDAIVGALAPTSGQPSGSSKT